MKKKVLALGYLPMWRGGRQATGLATGLFDLHDAVNEITDEFEVIIAATDVFKKEFKVAHTSVVGWTKGILLIHGLKNIYKLPFFILKAWSFSKKYSIIPFVDTLAKIIFLDYAINKVKPDIIHLHGVIYALYINALWKNSKPVVLRLHGMNGYDSTIPGYQDCKRMEKDILDNKYACVTFVTSDLCEDWKMKYGTFKCPMIPVINGYNKDVFYTPEMKQEKKYDLITISGVNDRKGQGRVIEALKMLKDEGIELSYLIVGTGPEEYMKKIKAYADEHSVNVTFMDYCAQDKLNDLLWISKWFIQPSASEGFGKTYIESAAAGIPFILPKHLPIVTERGVVSSKNAITIKDESAVEIYKTLKSIDFSTCYDENEVAKSVSHLAWQALAREYTKIYKSIE